MMGLIKTGIGFGLGYVLGARAGRQRYEQLLDEARRLSEHPKVQEASAKLPPALQQGLSRVVGNPVQPDPGADPGLADPPPVDPIDLVAPLDEGPGNPPVVNPVVFESSSRPTRNDLQ